MKAVLGLLAEIRKKNVVLEAQGNSLHYRAPRGIMTEELHKEIAKRKPDLIALLRTIDKFREAGWKGTIISQNRLEEMLSSTERRPRILCPYKGRPRYIHPEVCKWHREEKDPECEGCRPEKTMDFGEHEVSLTLSA